MRIPLNLRGKLIAVSITSVLLALAVSIFLDAQLAQRAFARRFQEDITTLAKELAAGFGGSPELDDAQTLAQKLTQIKEARPDIHHLAGFAHRAVQRPVARLVEAMQRPQAGTLDVMVQPRGRDELAQLTGHFNRMLENIRQDATEKERLLIQIQHFNEALQEKIRASTAELAQ